MKKRLIKKKKLLKRIIKHRLIITFGTIILVFPLIVGFLYFLPLPQIIAVDSGDLLAYYGTAFGIYLSFVTYSHEKKKEEKKRNKEIRPLLTVNVKQDDNNERVFIIKINNFSKNAITYFDLYDEHVSELFSKEKEIRVSYNQSVNDIDELNIDYNITCDSEIIDKDELPKYVQIICRDIDGNLWNCCFHRVKNGDNDYYYPDEFVINNI